MNERFETPILRTSMKIEPFPMNADVKEILEKVLQQNLIILEQNAEILRFLSQPMVFVAKDTED